MNDYIFGTKGKAIGLILLAIGLAVTWSSLSLIRNAAALDRSTATAEATITERFTVEEPCASVTDGFNKGCRQDVMHGRFSYSAEGQSFVGELRIGVRRQALATQDQFTLTYLPRDPTIWQIDPGDYADRASSNTVVGVVLALFGLLVFWLKGGFGWVQQRLTGRDT